MTLSVTLLGTGGPKPDPDRQGPSLIVRVNEQVLLFDAGRGVSTRLMQAGVQPQDLDAIIITHHHFDHIGNLGDLLLSIWNNGRTKPLAIYGPRGTKAIISALINDVYRADIAFRVKEAEITADQLFDLNDMLDITEVDAGPVLKTPDITLICARVNHGHTLGMSHEDWPCLGYRLESAGKTVAISGDTVDCEGLAELAQGADLLVLCCYLATVEQNGFERDVVSKHIIMSSQQAGIVAEKYGVKTLTLTHIRKKSAEILEQMASEISADFTGKLIVGKDLMTIKIGN